MEQVNNTKYLSRGTENKNRLFRTSDNVPDIVDDPRVTDVNQLINLTNYNKDLAKFNQNSVVLTYDFRYDGAI